MEPNRIPHAADFATWRTENGRKISIDLRSVVLASCDLRARLNRACLKNAKLRGARLAGAVMRGTDLVGAELPAADLSNTRYNTATKFPVDFGDPAARGMKLDNDPAAQHESGVRPAVVAKSWTRKP
jgi:Pentapeptide repeats (8 copies)